MPDSGLQSSRVQGILDLLAKLRVEHPGQKVATSSQSSKFLDIIAKALKRQKDGVAEIQCLRFDGTLNAAERLTARFAFRKSQDAESIMIMTAGAGGAGMSLTAASVVIQCEPWWVARTEWQAWARVRRPGQDREVAIYIFKESNSSVDAYIVDARDSEAEVVEEYIDKLRLVDEAELDIPNIIPDW
ncbi:P-loop containing nucleoside triphosphate hydrolase protein [Delphinella strobiligena]|nr:P-loop containing nucleoside triphosphate hydrolase protein [Delphinella strobiligena]